MTRRSNAALWLPCVCVLLFGARPVLAQPPAADPAQDPVIVKQTPMSDDDGALDPMEPDFALINLPTTLRLPRNAGNFHLSHRFNENLRNDSFGTQFENLFGIDTGANIGLEFRFGIARHLQAIVQRTSISRVIQFSAKYDAVHQSETRPVSVSVIVSTEGDNNYRRHHNGAVGAVLSRKVANRLAVYAMPFFVSNTTAEGQAKQNTSFVGLGGRVRVLTTTYLVAEVSPRIGGFVIRDPAYAFAIEKRVGAHVFSLTFTNNPGTTFRQLAAGGNPGTLNLGFNLTRKFF